MKSNTALSQTYDVVVVGGGHNGLTCAAYLAGQGKSVLVLERRDIVGGAAVTEEFHPGFRNSSASYTVSLLSPKVIKDLDLHRHGLQVVEREMANFFPINDQQYFCFSRDPDRQRTEFAKFSARDAAAAEAYHRDLEMVADELRSLLHKAPPNTAGGLTDLVRAASLAWKNLRKPVEAQRLLLDMATASCMDILDRYFEHPVIKAAYAFDGIVGAYTSPYALGTGYVLLHHCFGETNGKKGVWGHAIGGMGAISDAMSNAAREAGAEIRVGASVKEIIISDGVASGVILDSGEHINAKAVAAGINPKFLFRDLVDDQHVPDDFRKRIKGFKCGSGTFRMNVALSELPDFKCLPSACLPSACLPSACLPSACLPSIGEHHSAGIIIGPNPEYLDNAYLEARTQGWSKNPIIEMLIPSTLDDSLAPKGQHVASLFCQHFAYDLGEGRSWDGEREKAADAIIETVTKYAPNFRSSIIARQIHSPLDLERKFGLPEGDIFHGQLTPNQLFSARPVLGHADHRMPIKCLYLCGSGAHPGGGVTGIPGHNAAHIIAKDL